MKLGLKTLLLFFALSIGTAHAAPENYYIPPQYTTATIEITTQVDTEDNDAPQTGTFEVTTGAFKFDPDKKTLSDLRLALSVISVQSETSNMMREILASLKSTIHPEITFSQTSPASFEKKKTASVKGDLSLAGDEREVDFKATLKKQSRRKVSFNLKSNFSLEPNGKGKMIELAIKFNAIKN